MSELKVKPMLGCVPVNKKERLNIPWEPSPNCRYEISECSKCGTDIYLGLRQKKLRDEHGCEAMCIKCILTGSPQLNEKDMCVLSEKN